jgi:hypothetical protein
MSVLTIGVGIGLAAEVRLPARTTRVRRLPPQAAFKYKALVAAGTTQASIDSCLAAVDLLRAATALG